MNEKEILFVCVENAGRSQMAEAFFKKIGPKNYSVLSAGTRPAEKVNPKVVEVMNEIGIDIGNKKPKILSEKIIPKTTKTVNMGCMDQKECPALFTSDILDWNIPDPKGKSIEEVREIRDLIESKIKDLVFKLKDES